MNALWLLHQYGAYVKTWFRDLGSDPVLQENRRFRDIHNGERLFILGSGTSILEQDLTLLNKHIVMTQNHFHAHEQIGIINPTYHVIVPKYQPTEYDKDWVEWLRSMDERLPKETILFFGRNTKYLVDQLGLFPGRAFYTTHGYPSAVLKNAPVDMTKILMLVPTALLQCLAIAIYMGFKEIFLVGMDMDQMFRIHQRDKVRFYGLSPITANQAEVDLEKQGASGEDWIGMWIIWQQCRLLREEAERRGITIVNATRGGVLSCFDRRVYEEVI